MELFIHPSLREAIACEKAVIGTPIGGIRNALTDCENGRLVRTSAASELANAINELLANETLRRKLGGAVCQTIMNKFTQQTELDGNLVLYRRPGLKMQTLSFHVNFFEYTKEVYYPSITGDK